MNKSFFRKLKGDDVYQNKIFSFKTTAIKKPASEHDPSWALLFAWLPKFSFVPPAISHKPARKLSFSSGERSKSNGERASERRDFRVSLTRDFSRPPQMGDC